MLAIFAVGVLVTGTDPAVIGAAGLAAPFGGAGFGAMMGAVLGAIQVSEAEVAQEQAAATTVDEAGAGLT